MGRRSALWPVAVSLTACLLAACAQTMSKAEYTKLVQSAEKQRSTALAGFSSAQTSDASFYRGAAKDLRATAASLEDVAAPSDISAANESYIASLTGLAGVMESFAQCAELDKKHASVAASGQDCRREIDQARLDEVQNDFDEAAAIFRAKGYSLTA